MQRRRNRGGEASVWYFYLKTTAPDNSRFSWSDRGRENLGRRKPVELPAKKKSATTKGRSGATKSYKKTGGDC